MGDDMPHSTQDTDYKRSKVGFTLPPHSALTSPPRPPPPSFMAEVNRTSPRASHTLSRLTQDVPTVSAIERPAAGSDIAEQPITTPNLSAPLRAQPSRKFLQIIEPLLDKPTSSLEPVDFRGGKGAEGTSYLLSMLMDKIAVENAHLSPIQLNRIARHAAFCHPVFLTRGLRQAGERNIILTRGLQQAVLDNESILCPMDTPHLISDGRLRDRAEDPTTLSRKDLLNAIFPFVRCCYPRSADKLRKKYESLPTERLTILFDTGGAFYKFTQSLTSGHIFDPPQWTIIPGNRETTTPPEGTTSPSTPFLPITRMGMDIEEFMRLSPTQQKFTALTTLPSAFSQIILPAEVVAIMAQIGLTPNDDILAYLQSADLIQQVGDAHKNRLSLQHTPTHRSLPVYRNRYRMRHTGRGPTWGSAGEVLRLWLTAVMPPLLGDGHSFTLIRRPVDQSSDDIVFTDPTIPSADVLEHYTYDTKLENGNLTQLEFWFTTSVPEMGSGRIKPSFSGEKLYLSRLNHNAMSLMRMESYRADMVPCIMLINSSVRDLDSMIKAELVSRLPAGQEIAHLFEIGWYGIHTASRPNVMAKCVLTTPGNFHQITTRFAPMARGDMTRHPVSYDYVKVVLPSSPTSKLPDISGALSSQRRFHEDTTSTYLYGMEGLNPFTIVPLRSFLPGSSTTEMNLHSIAHLLTNGRLEDSDGVVKPSPV